MTFDPRQEIRSLSRTRDAVLAYCVLVDPISGDLITSLSVTTDPKEYAIRYDETATGITYIGKAVPGTSAASALWQIRKLDETLSPDFNVTFADGNADFDNVWNDRDSLTYS